MTYNLPQRVPQRLPIPRQPAMPEPTDEELMAEEAQSAPAPNEDNVNYMPETGLSENDLEDIFGVGERADGSIDEQERVDTDDVTGDDGDDYSDVLDFDESDITGEPPKPAMRFKRTSRPYRPMPPSSLGGMRL